MFKTEARPDVELCIDGTWYPGELRAWFPSDDGTWRGNVRYSLAAGDNRLDTFPGGSIRRTKEPPRHP